MSVSHHDRFRGHRVESMKTMWASEQKWGSEVESGWLAWHRPLQLPSRLGSLPRGDRMGSDAAAVEAGSAPRGWWRSPKWTRRRPRSRGISRSRRTPGSTPEQRRHAGGGQDRGRGRRRPSCARPGWSATAIEAFETTIPPDLAITVRDQHEGRALVVVTMAEIARLLRAQETGLWGTVWEGTPAESGRVMEEGAAADLGAGGVSSPGADRRRWYGVLTHRAPFMTPEAWERFEALWCRPPGPRPASAARPAPARNAANSPRYNAGIPPCRGPGRGQGSPRGATRCQRAGSELGRPVTGERDMPASRAFGDLDRLRQPEGLSGQMHRAAIRYRPP